MKITCLYLFIIRIVVLFRPLSAKNLYVNSSYDGTQAGTLEQPCKSISKCVYDYASDDDVIYLTPGIYSGVDNARICGSYLTRSKNCTASRLTLSGLHDNANEVIWSFSGPSSQNGRALESYNNRFTLIANMTIRDFTIINNATVTSVTSSYQGGALNVRNSTMVIYNVQFINNSAAIGGSVLCMESNVTVIDSSFRHNSALISGGALSSEESSLRLNNTSFNDNIVFGNAATESFGKGGAVYYLGQSPDTLHIYGGEFNNNTAPEAGGALYVQSLDGVVITGTLFKNNLASGNGLCRFSSSACQVTGGAIFSSVSGIVLTEVTFISNTATSAYPGRLHKVVRSTRQPFTRKLLMKSGRTTTTVLS